MKPNLYVIFFVLSLTISHKLLAVEKYWTGTASNNWNNASNWNPSGVPTTSDVVYIRNATVNPVIQNGTTATANAIVMLSSTLTVNSGGILNASGTINTAGMGLDANAILQNNGTINLQEKISVNGLNCSIVNNGQLSINSTDIYGIIVYRGYSLTITNNASGVLALASGKYFTIPSGSTGTITNSGTISAGYISAAPGSTFELTNNACGKVITEAIYQNNGGPTTNAGFFQVGSNLEHTGGIFTNNGVLKYGSQRGNGIVSIANSSVIVNNTPTPIFTYGGTYNGTINGIYTNSGATTSAGTFTAPNTFVPSTGLPNGSQTLYAKITPSGGACSYVVPFTYTYDAAPTITNFTTVDNTVCAGSSIDFTATIGGSISGSYNYTLTNGSSTTTGSSSSTSLSLSRTAAESGVQTFTLTVSDGGPSASATTNVTVNALPTVNSVPAGVALTCSAPTYSLTATGTGTVLWSTGATTPVISATAAGVYSVTLTDANGCQATDFSTVSTNNNPPVALLSASGTLNCAVSSVTLTVQTVFGVSFAFSSGASQIGGSSGRSATVTTPGIYSVTATGANGCTSTSSVTVLSDVASPTASVNSVVNQLDCNTTVITLTASGGGTYLWSNGQTTATRNVNIAGTYSVTVTGANGCTAVASKTITSNTTPPTLALSAPSVCAGQAISLSATSGLTSYTFTGPSGVIAGSGNTRTVTGLPTGTYSFSVLARSNVNSCIGTDVVSTTVNASPMTTLVSNGPLTCAQTSVTLTASGGTSYTFANGSGILGTPGTTNTLVINSPATYSVTVANAGGCISTTSTTVSSNTALITVTNPASATTLQSTPFSQTFIASGGVSPRSFSLTSGSLPTGLSLSTTGVLSGTPTQIGSFSITVRATDANGCSGVGSVYTLVINDPTPTLTAFAPYSTTVCTGSPISFSAMVGNVSGSYAYTLTNGSSTTMGTTASTNFSQSLTANGTGLQTFTLTVNDGGPSTSATTTVTVNALPIVTISATPSLTITYGFPVSMTASGASTYLWNVGAPSATLSPTPGITTVYSVTGTSSGCSASASVTVYVVTPTISNLAASSGAVCVGSPVTFTATLGNVTGSYTYTLTNGNSTQLSGDDAGSAFSHGFTTSRSGLQSFTLTIKNGVNYVSTTADLLINDLPIPGLQSSETLTCANTSVTLTASGGTSYTFGAGATQIGSSNQATVNTSGLYSVTVANAGGCINTAIIMVNSNQTPPSLSISPSSGTISCNTSSVSLSAIGTGTFLWNTGQTTTSINASSGTYSVTATGTNGCTATSSVSISSDLSSPLLSLNYIGTTLTCESPALSLSALGVGTFRWNTGETSPVISVSIAGTYSVTLIGANGCTASSSLQFTSDKNPPSLSISPSSGTLTCASPAVSLTAIGTGTLLWSTGATSSQISVSEAGPYSVTLTGVNGCSSTATTSIISTTSVLAISNPTTVTAVVNQPFSQPFSASAGVSPYSFSLASGSLPTGLSLASTGVLSGTPSQSGSFSITVRATDANGCSGIGTTYTVAVIDLTPTIAGLAANPGSVCINSPVTFTATVGNVSATYAYTLTNGSSTSITGTASSTLFSQSITPNSAGSQSFTLTIRANSLSVSTTTNLLINNVPTAMLTTNGPLTCAQTSVTLTASGGTSYTFTSASGTLGTPGPSNTLVVTNAGTYSVTVANASGCLSTSTTTVASTTSIPALSVSPSSATLTNASPTASLSATGTGTFRWSTGETSPVISVTSSGIYSVTLTNTATGCTATAAIPVHGSDLTTTLELPQANFASSGTGTVGNLVVKVFEVGGLPTSSGNVTITITAPIGYALTFPASLTSITVSGGTSPTSVNNVQWTVTNSLTDRQLTLTMNSGAFIGAGGESRVGFIITRTTASSGSIANITVNVADDLTMTYDGNLSNNGYARVITGL